MIEMTMVVMMPVQMIMLMLFKDFDLSTMVFLSRF